MTSPIQFSGIKTPQRRTPAESKRQASENSVRFSGTGPQTSFWRSFSFSKLNSLVRIFRPVLEVFFWGVMAIDVIALWLPRIFNSLTVGAFDYKPEDDPKLKGKKGFNRFMHIAKERGKRLNWVNALEETGREAASGPAIFVYPTVIFVMSRLFGDKTGVELGKTPLSRMVDTFIKQIKANPVGTDEQKYKQAMKHFVSSLFGEEGFKTHKLKTNPNKTYEQAIHEWSGRWVDEVFKGHQLGWSELSKRNSHHNNLDKLKNELMDLVQTYNREHQTEARLYQYEKTPISWFERQANGAYKKILNDKKQMPLEAAEEVFGNLMRWKDFSFNVLKESPLYTKGVSPQLLDYTMRRLKFRKAVASGVSTVATLTFLFQLVKWTQSHDKYPAYRLVNAEDGHGPTPTPIKKPMPSQLEHIVPYLKGSQTPVQPFLASASFQTYQPGFSPSNRAYQPPYQPYQAMAAGG